MKTTVDKTLKTQQKTRPEARQSPGQYGVMADTFAELGNQMALGVIQAKMKIGAANDPAEQEADRIAAQVAGSGNISGAMGPSGASGEAVVQRSTRADAGKGAFDADSSFQAGMSSGSGRDLDARIKESIGKRLGADFSGVRIHNDDDAARKADAIGARAFTIGKDIYFGKGEYAPGTVEGQRLLAHELTHTVQQGAVEQSGGEIAVQQSVDAATVQRKPKIVSFFQKLFRRGGSEENHNLTDFETPRPENEVVPVLDPNEADVVGEVTLPPMPTDIQNNQLSPQEMMNIIAFQSNELMTVKQQFAALQYEYAALKQQYDQLLMQNQMNQLNMMQNQINQINDIFNVPPPPGEPDEPFYSLDSEDEEADIPMSPAMAEEQRKKLARTY